VPIYYFVDPPGQEGHSRSPQIAFIYLMATAMPELIEVNDGFPFAPESTCDPTGYIVDTTPEPEGDWIRHWRTEVDRERSVGGEMKRFDLTLRLAMRGEFESAEVHSRFCPDGENVLTFLDD
jgi:hypothetical protein